MLNNFNTIIALWVLSIILSVTYLSTSVNIDTSLISIFSNNSEESNNDALNPSLIDDSNLLVFGSIEGTDKNKLAEYNKEFIKSLRNTQKFDFIANGELPSTVRVDNPLFSYRYLLSTPESTNPYNTENIKNSFHIVYKKLRSPFIIHNKNILASDPTDSWKKYLRSFISTNQPKKHNGVWFSSDNERTLFLLALSKDASQIEYSEQQASIIYQTFDEILGKKNADIKLTLSGPALFAINSRNTIRSETQNLSLLATASIIFILLIAYRSARLVILSAIPVATAILFSVVCVNIFFGSIHGITLAFGATLLGVVIDYPIHLFSHIRKNKNITHSVHYCWPVIRLGMITTVIAYSAMALSDFAGLAQLGVFAITGIITGAIATRWIVPELISIKMDSERFSSLESITKHIMNPRRIFAVITISLSTIIIFSALLYNQGEIWRSDLRQFSSVPEISIKQYTSLKDDLRVPDSADIIMISGSDPEFVLRKTEAISNTLTSLLKNNDLKSFEAASQYLPSKMTQSNRQDLLPSTDVLLTSINEALTGMNLKKTYFKAFLDDIATTKTLDPLTPTNPLVKGGNLLGKKLSSLLFQQGDKWISIIPLNGVKNETIIHQAIDRIPSSGNTKIKYINSHKELSSLMDQYLTDTIKRIMIGSGILLLILGISLANLKQFVRVVFPISLSAAVTMSLLILTSGGLSIFHMVALLLTVGISIDYALFLSRDAHNIHEKQNTLTSIIICAVSTISVFAILGSSDIPVLQAIGQTVSIGVIVAFILSLSLSQSQITFQRESDSQ